MHHSMVSPGGMLTFCLGLRSWSPGLQTLIYQQQSGCPDSLIPNPFSLLSCKALQGLDLFIIVDNLYLGNLLKLIYIEFRKNELPLDKMCLVCEVTKKHKEEITAAPREGAYIHGLFMEVRHV